MAFLERRPDWDEPRSGSPRIVDAACEVITAPRDRDPLGTRSMAQRSGLSHNTVSLVSKAGLRRQPHRTEIHVVVGAEKVRDVVGLSNPPDRALVLCVDEKSRSRRWMSPVRYCPDPASGTAHP